LDSVLAQTLTPIEVILVDDGSDDGTEHLVARGYPGVRYLRQEKRGVSAARNRGIEVASGAWIALLDSDDAWLPGKLDAQREAMRRQPNARLCHTEEIWVRRGVRVNPKLKHAKSGGWIFHRCLPRCAISPSSALISRELLEEAGGFDEDLPACEDYDLWLRVCAREPVVFVDQPQIVKYGGHADQLSRRHWGMDRFRVRALEKLIADGSLSREYRQAAIRTLIEKAEILALGAEKRGQWERARELRGKQRRFAAMMDQETVAHHGALEETRREAVLHSPSGWRP
jgi:glycosyltransferase involved in cell wall biosynthesis